MARALCDGYGFSLVHRPSKVMDIRTLPSKRRMARDRWIALATVVIAAAATPVLAQGPPNGAASAARSETLPALVFDTLPQSVRAELQRAYDVARERATDGPTVGRLAMLLHAFEQHRLAGAYYALARRLDDRAFEWRYLSGVVLAELGDDAAAAAAFRLALAVDGASVPAHVRLAESLMRAGDLEASRAEYVAVLRTVPDLALAIYGLGRVEAALGRPAAAIGRYRRALEVAPEFGGAHYALALAYRDAGLPERAQPHLAQHARYGHRRPSLPDPLLDRVRSLRSTARDLIADAARRAADGDLAGSIALHLRALERDPSVGQAHVNLISLYGRTGQPAQAAHHYRAALTLAASVADAHYNYGVLVAATDRQRALALFRAAVAANPFHAAAHHNLAGLLAQAGRLDEAAAHYRQAIANAPNHPTSRTNLERVLALRAQQAAPR